MKLGTYNVNYGRPGHRHTLAAISRLDADCLFLQETSPSWERELRRHQTSYRFVAFRHWKPGRAGGHGLLSRYPILVDEVLDAPTGWFPAWRVVIATPSGPLQVLSVHLRPPFSVANGFHRSFFRTPTVRQIEITAHHARLDHSLPTVILGDFNESDGPALAYLAANGFQRAALDDHTWRLLGWRRTYDHIFGGPGVALHEPVVIAAGASDHLPLTARVVLHGRSVA